MDGPNWAGGHPCSFFALVGYSRPGGLRTQERVPLKSTNQLWLRSAAAQSSASQGLKSLNHILRALSLVGISSISVCSPETLILSSVIADRYSSCLFPSGVISNDSTKANPALFRRESFL